MPEAENAKDIKATGKQRAAIDAAVQEVTQLVADDENMHYGKILIVLADEKVRYEVSKSFPNKPMLDKSKKARKMAP